MGLAKYINGRGQADTPVIKVEPVLTAQMEEALVGKGWSRPSGRGGYRVGGSRGSPSPFDNYNHGNSSSNPYQGNSRNH